MEKKETIFVGLSGGVDSSVAALLLKQAGYDVVGVFIKVWHPDFLVCNWEQERLDAMRVAAALDIPFLTCDAVAEYKQGVADYFIESYRHGHTPNPDVVCNTHIKFGAFWEFAKARGADGIATGHYARIKEQAGACTLHRSVDTEKDQSYFLWNISESVLPYVHFPIGGMQKKEVREIAKKHTLPTAQKDESQGICFLGHVDIPEFLSHYIELSKGDVLDINGDVVGTHDGAAVYTIGQRHGFTFLAHSEKSTPHFVIAKNLEENTITVSTEPPRCKNGILHLVDCNTLGVSAATLLEKQIVLQIRYRQTPIAAVVTSVTEETMQIQLKSPTEMPALGQSCVLYLGTQCLAGGSINTVE